MSAEHSLWYKDAIIYEVLVRAFFDSDGDGKGDFPGLTAQLDYIQDLGVTAIWLLPFYPSPWRDDGYDASHYTEIHPAYGTMRDFQVFLREAHRRGLRVITELILNHTSDQHPWFQRSRRAAPGSRWRDFYVWSQTPDKYQEAKIIFRDFQDSNWSWDPVAGAYYWHRFYRHQPDLNFDNPLVRRAMFRVVDFWLDQGVDGFRLDAVPYLFEREGTACEHLPETHAYLKELRAHIDGKYEDRVLLAEANVWPEDAASYLGPGECHLSFHFPLMPRLFSANRMEESFPITDILRQTPELPAASQWALFLRNHDELTLETVTSEERDYMYRVYAQDPQARINLGIRRRLAPLLENDRRRIELMNALLLSLPGTPVIYYGDEIGMGDNMYLGDRNGVRTPMQWSPDRNAGFSRANPQRLYLPVNIDPLYHYEAVNVEVQQQSGHSLLRWMRRALAVRRQFRAFGSGAMELLQTDNHRVLAFLRRHGEEKILVLANLSRFVQSVGLDLREFQGLTPVEMLGRSELAAVTGAARYPVTLGPYAFYWLSLENRQASIELIHAQQGRTVAQAFPSLQVQSWADPFDQAGRAAIARLLPGFLRTRQWFRSAHRTIESAVILDTIPIRPSHSHLLMTRVDYTDGDPETYALMAAVASGEDARRIEETSSDAVAAHLECGAERGVLYSALWDRDFLRAMFDAVARRKRIRGDHGEVVGLSLRNGGKTPALEPRVSQTPQSNTSIAFGDKFILKLYRRVEAGVDPEKELGAALMDAGGFPQMAAVAGSLEYRPAQGASTPLGIMHVQVAHETDGWRHALDAVSQYFERAQSQPQAQPAELLGPYLQSARLMGQRTAELHRAIHRSGLPRLSFNDAYRQELYYAVSGLATQTLRKLRGAIAELPLPHRQLAQTVLELEPAMTAVLRRFRDTRMTGSRIRVHGNFQLSELLYTGADFVIIDFGGDSTRHFNERRTERSVLWDVVSMRCSMRHAAHSASFGNVPGVNPSAGDQTTRQGAELWSRHAGEAFLGAYLAALDCPELLPQTAEQMGTLMSTLTLQRELSLADRHMADANRLAIALRGLAACLHS